MASVTDRVRRFSTWCSPRFWGGVTLVAGIVALSGGSAAALGTLTAAMVSLWALATIRHSRSRSTPEVIHPAR